MPATSLLRRLPVLAALLVCLPLAARAATTRNVPAQYATIQAAVNAAVTGDTVLVADGTYSGTGNRDIDLLGKTVTVKSVHGAAKTILDCGGTSAANHRGFYLHSGEQNAVIQGFTVKNGYEGDVNGVINSGAGVCIDSGLSSSASLQNCLFVNNTTGGFGDGGGVYNNGGLNMSGCTFTGNTANHGGGLCNVGSTGLTNCNFVGNSAVVRNASDGQTGSGGGVYSNGGLGLTACNLVQNTAARYGGGIFSTGDSSRATLTNCTVLGNTAGSYGGGVCSDTATGGSGGAAVNCTVIQNTSGNGGGGGIADLDDGFYVVNDIVYGNSGGQLYDGAEIVASNSDVQGGFSGTANIDADPQFVRNPNLAATPPDFGDLRLKPTSPCLGAGVTDDPPLATDEAGVTRPDPPSIGAFEKAASTAPTLKSLSFSPSTVVGGFQNTTGTVTLSGATATARVVSLASNSFTISFPSSTVTIPAGATSATFRAYSHGVNAAKTATVTAALGSVTKTATITVAPPPAVTLQNLTFSPSTIVGSQSTTGTVTLTAPATTNLTVSLSSISAAVYPYPSSTVTIPAGAMSATFQARSGHSATTQVVKIKATLGGVEKTAYITVTP